MIPLVTPQNRYYADLSDPAKFRIITILGRPPDITCTPKHACYVGGIVITLQQFTKESATTTEWDIYTRTTQTSHETTDALQRYKAQRKQNSIRLRIRYKLDWESWRYPWRPYPCPGRAGGIPKLTSSDFKPVDSTKEYNPKMGQAQPPGKQC